jgi:4-phytase / acid phosphatase
MSQLRWLICALLLVTSALAQDSSGKLKMAVIVTRHGVRPQLEQDPQWPYAKERWPTPAEWGARCAGDLTKTGTRLATLMGSYYSDHYREQHLLPPRCPSQQVYIWADAEERTWETAAALAQGLSQRFPGCRVKVNAVQPPDERCGAENPHDYFFHPMEKFKADPDQINKIVDDLKRRLPGLRKQYQPRLEALQKAMICCSSDKCSPLSSCTLLDLPDAFTINSKNGAFKWTGPFPAGSTATELFLLEYANGFPCDSQGLGWRRVAYRYTSPDCGPSTGPFFRPMQRIHTLYFELVNRDPYLATIQGSNLANQVLLRLQEGAAGTPPSPLVIYSGHDTNIANIAGMLGIHWLMSDLPQDDTPPAGALVFELYEGKSPAGLFVKLRYVHATMAQMRRKAILSLADPPEWSEITIPNCSEPCSFTKFQGIMTKAIDKNFITTKASGD